MKNSFISILAMGFIFFALACTQPTPTDQIVARVGDSSIGKGELEEFAANLTAPLRSKQSGDGARRDYLQTLITEKCLVLEARDRGLHENPQLLDELESAFGKRLIRAYHVKNINPKITISEEELRARFRDGGHYRERVLHRLVVQTLEEAKALRDRLKQGADFAELASIHSRDPQTLSKGGLLGFIGQTNLTQVYVPPDVFANLPAGEISPPLPVQGFYQLIYFGEEREASFAAHREKIQKLLWREKWNFAYQNLLEKLAAKLELRLETAGLEILVGKKPDSSSEELSPAEGATPLYVYHGGKITTGDYIRASRQIDMRPVLGDSLGVVNSAWQLVIPEKLLWQAAREEGLHRTEQMRHWKTRKEIDLLIKALRQTAAADQVLIDEKRARQYYEDHLKAFRRPVQVSIQEILLDDLNEALDLRQKLDDGAAMDTLIYLSQRPGAAEHNGAMHFHSYESFVYGILVQLALETETGQLVGPVEVEEGYSVFRVLKKEGGEVQPFEEVRTRAEGLLYMVERERLFNEMLEGLNEKFADRIQIFEEVLHQVQLPE